MAIDRHRWVLDMIEAAKPTAAKIGVSPEAIVAQAALESGWGRAAIGHNLFGIKASAGWTGKTRTMRTREVDANGRDYYIDAVFRDYDSYAESIADHFAFLDRNSRYRANGVFDAKGDEHYFRALQRAGYATDPHYANTLMNVLATVRALAATKPAPVPWRVLWLTDPHMQGDDVEALQRALNKALVVGLTVDGDFGPHTEKGVRWYQTYHGLTIDGIVGEETRNALGLPT